jgi:Holliday junction resolvase RusA-like endonuclease
MMDTRGPRFTNVMEIINGGERCLSFTSIGDPPVQARPKIVWRFRPIPVYYDPSARAKAAFERSLRESLLSFGVTSFPYFNREAIANTKGLKLTLDLFLHRKKLDYRVVKGVEVLREDCDNFPKKKDVDNMLKFIMDALHHVIYDNDNVITCVLVTKEFIPESGRNGPAFSEIRLEKRF